MKKTKPSVEKLLDLKPRHDTSKEETKKFFE